MEVVLKKWGNSLGIRIPKSFTEQIQVREGTKLSLKIEDGAIMIKKAENLKENLLYLVENITSANIHSEIESGKPQGNEIW